jgi:hypothetical protein
MDMKKTLTILLLLLAPAFVYCGMLKGSQFDTAKKYADKDEAPVVFFDPGSGDAKGYILYADLNGDGENEMVIPYRVRKPLAEIEDKADIYPQILSVDVVTGEKKFRGFFEVELAYNHTPKVYMTSKALAENALPKVFLMVSDGIKKKESVMDQKMNLMYNSYDKADKKREQKVFETDKMPFEMILYQFDSSEPTITEFDINYEQSYGQFYIRPLDNPEKSVRVSEEAMKKFEDELKNTRNDIFFEYAE